MPLTRVLIWTAAAAALTALVGCETAPIPVAKNFEYTSQYKVRSAGHWDLVARDVAFQTRAMLESAGIGDATPLHVVAPSNPSAFDLGFRDFLITQLVHDGAVVRTDPAAALAVSYGTQVVRHNSDRPHFIPGAFTMLAGGLAAAYGLRLEHIDTKIVAGLGLAVGMDYAASINSGGPTNTELILTTTVTRDGQYVARKTDVYYLENVDTPLFMRPSYYRAVNMKVVSQ
ncbi:MAG: hypothetical protein ABT03_07800 [Comamonas sp. SCN 67-35]|uniref:hypothetical protein n=1 Tax=unclassified Comamonas TaxID=2638500 RepID=UPI0008696DB1|nr:MULTISPECIES: hypothetical protein [unclassified Comamonas]MBN9328957.1 hypothetical protein [Comamonas sp.]ODU38660.1 MAG: hypothetical protein ABT03_07800 [Comamonas sp. SCN 67-35]OJX01919.1 MAG: hypothetical protein BGO73_02315 [Burkholderiales bacterium 66-26]